MKVKSVWVRNLSTDQYRSCYDPKLLNPKYNFVEVATKWKIMLLELGRKTPEFKPNDVIVTHQDLYLAGYHDHDEIVLLFEENLVIRFCPEEHSVEVES